MNVTQRTHSTGYPIFTIQTGDSEFELSSFGGQLLSWTKAGRSVLFANRNHAVVDGKTPYRGGAPICFPYFGKGQLLPGSPLLTTQHGHARTTVWSSEVREDSVVFRTEQPSAEGFGPTTLSCELTYVFRDDLQVQARVENVGENEAPFQLAVHSYWACSNPSAVTVSGLGERFLDNLVGYKASIDPEPSSAHVAPYDRVYPDASNDLELLTDAYRLSIKTEGGAGTVLWNPGPHHKIADLGSPDFVCVESGVISPARVLAAGNRHLVTISYAVEVFKK